MTDTGLLPQPPSSCHRVLSIPRGVVLFPQTALTLRAKLLQFLVWLEARVSHPSTPSHHRHPFLVALRNPRLPTPFSVLASRPSREIYSNSNSSTTSRPWLKERTANEETRRDEKQRVNDEGGKGRGEVTHRGSRRTWRALCWVVVGGAVGDVGLLARLTGWQGVGGARGTRHSNVTAAELASLTPNPSTSLQLLKGCTGAGVLVFRGRGRCLARRATIR